MVCPHLLIDSPGSLCQLCVSCLVCILCNDHCRYRQIYGTHKFFLQQIMHLQPTLHKQLRILICRKHCHNHRLRRTFEIRKNTRVSFQDILALKQHLFIGSLLLIDKDTRTGKMSQPILPCKCTLHGFLVFNQILASG